MWVMTLSLVVLNRQGMEDVFMVIKEFRDNMRVNMFSLNYVKMWKYWSLNKLENCVVNYDLVGILFLFPSKDLLYYFVVLFNLLHTCM